MEMREIIQTRKDHSLDPAEVMRGGQILDILKVEPTAYGDESHVECERRKRQ